MLNYNNLHRLILQWLQEYIQGFVFVGLLIFLNYLWMEYLPSCFYILRMKFVIYDQIDSTQAIYPIEYFESQVLLETHQA